MARTRQQKIEWLKKADTETLLKNYEFYARKMASIFDADVSIEDARSISENYDLIREEVVSRIERR